jgi:hypothetical protein
MVLLAIVSLLVLLGGCAPTNISIMQDKLGPPGDVVQKGNLTIYYYYTYFIMEKVSTHMGGGVMNLLAKKMEILLKRGDIGLETIKILRNLGSC